MTGIVRYQQRTALPLRGSSLEEPNSVATFWLQVQWGVLRHQVRSGLQTHPYEIARGTKGAAEHPAVEWRDQTELVHRLPATELVAMKDG